MQTAAVSTAPATKKGLWAGRIISGLVVLFMLFDSGLKLVRAKPAIEGTVKLGYPTEAVFIIGVILLICTILYVVPRTAVLGAILLTGHLGGAVASNFRVSNPLLGYTLFPVYVGVLLWLGLYLRDARLRALVPLRSLP
jgi:hypothetical protein